MSSNTLGRYRIIRELGRSNDIVYEALDTSINRRVALKELVLPPNLTGVERNARVERFYREARAAGSLAHPNIVTIYEVGEDQGRRFIAMEFLEGQTLRNLLDMEGKLTPERTIEIILQVCDALSYAHSRGVIHRDIKPDNIQILPDGRVKITDFGIARIMDEPGLTVPGQTFGTPSYMSPEQISGKPINQTTDIFSLGIVICEMVTGRKPFTGETVVTVTYNIMNTEPEIPPTIPPRIGQIIKRCLAKDPYQRYQTAGELAADLMAAKSDSLVQPTQYIPPATIVGTHGGTNSTLATPKPKRTLLSSEVVYALKVFAGVVATVGFVVILLCILLAGYNGQATTDGNGASKKMKL